MTRVHSMPQLADRITFGLASSMRVASSLAAKPPNTTEWMAPSRAQASMPNTPPLRQQAAISEALHLVGDRGIVDQRRLVIAPGQHVAVERVVAGVAAAAREPAAIDAGVLVEDLLRLLVPVA